MLCEIFPCKAESGELSWCWVQQCQEENKSRLCEAVKLSVEARELTMFITFLDNYSPPDNGSVEQRTSLGQIRTQRQRAGAGTRGGRSGQQWHYTGGTQSAHTGNVCTTCAELSNSDELDRSSSA